jgi:hypothetical protein
LLAAGTLGASAGIPGCASGGDPFAPAWTGDTGSVGEGGSVGAFGDAGGSVEDAFAPGDAGSIVGGDAGSSLGADAAPDPADAVADQGGAGNDASATEAGRPVPTLLAKQQVCKLINGQAEGDPTANQAPTRANLVGTDLGIPVEANGTLYFFFGDSHGNKGIWQPGQSFPDTVGYSLDSATALATNPALLCSDLRFLTLSPSSSLGPTIDPTIVADFAATAMSPPNSTSIGQFVHNPSGDSQNSFPYLPGTFEVPSGAFADSSGALYLFYTTVASPTDTTMKASYLARWSAPSSQGAPGFDVLYPIDERFDSKGALYGDFVNVAAETSGGYVYLLGTGDYRKSPVHLARKSLTSLGAPGGFELYDAASGSWGTTRGAPIVATPGYGETSVRYFAAIGRWMFLAEDLAANHNQIVASFADGPEGPWSAPVVVHDMADPAFLAQYCCGQTCPGQQMIHCDRAAFYGAYLLPELALQPDGSFTVTYTLSTWDPYDVVLMQATFSGGG